MLRATGRNLPSRPGSVERWGLLLVLAAILLLAGTPAFGGEGFPSGPGKGEKCPVCGMFVAKYKDFLSAVRFRDGAHVYFDGPKELFRYLHGMTRDSPAARPEALEAGFVKGYSSLEFIDGPTAFYVTGSDVYGPMGKELVPFGREQDTRQFLKDHKGKSLLRFGEITKEVLEGLQ